MWVCQRFIAAQRLVICFGQSLDNVSLQMACSSYVLSSFNESLDNVSLPKALNSSLEDDISTEVWRTCVCQVICESSHLVATSIRVWTTWIWQTFYCSHLACNSTSVWTMWPCRAATTHIWKRFQPKFGRQSLPSGLQQLATWVSISMHEFGLLGVFSRQVVRCQAPDARMHVVSLSGSRYVVHELFCPYMCSMHLFKSLCMLCMYVVCVRFVRVAACLLPRRVRLSCLIN